MPLNYMLHIYGTGSLEKYVQEHIKNIKNIKYFGFQPFSLIFNDLKKAKAMIFPSLLYEGYPMIIAESFSVGCPVISTNIGNEGDIILDSKGGVVFNLEDKNDFIVAIEEIIKNNDLYRKNAKLYYDKKLNIKKNYERLSEIYDKAKTI